MTAYLLFLIFLFIYFIIFPLMLNNPSKRICKFWEKKKHTSSYPKFLGFLLAFSMVSFNVIYYACASSCLGFALSSAMMIPLFFEKTYLYLFSKLRNNDKCAACYGLTILILIFSIITFPVAVIMALVLLFACLMPKHETKNENGISALETVASKISDETEQVATPLDEHADCIVLSQDLDNPEKTKKHEPKKSSRSCRPNRHSNGSNYKKSGKVRNPHFYSMRHLKPSLKSNSKSSRHHG